MKDDFYGKAYNPTKGSRDLIWTSQNRAHKDTEIWTFYFRPGPEKGNDYVIKWNNLNDPCVWEVL